MPWACRPRNSIRSLQRVPSILPRAPVSKHRHWRSIGTAGFAHSLLPLSPAERLTRRALESFCENQPFPSPCKVFDFESAEVLSTRASNRSSKLFCYLGEFLRVGRRSRLLTGPQVGRRGNTNCACGFSVRLSSQTLKSRTSCSRD